MHEIMGILQNRLHSYFGILAIISCLFLFTGNADAQVNAVEFGKNRVQYEKFKWRYYQTRNFNVYFSQNGLALGKYAAQLAEKELPQLEQERDELTGQLSNPDLSFEKLQQYSERINELNRLIDEKEMRWLELSE